MVYTYFRYFRTWRRNGTGEHLHTLLREWMRQQVGREPTPTAAMSLHLVCSACIRTLATAVPSRSCCVTAKTAFRGDTAES